MSTFWIIVLSLVGGYFSIRIIINWIRYAVKTDKTSYSNSNSFLAILCEGLLDFTFLSLIFEGIGEVLGDIFSGIDL